MELVADMGLGINLGNTFEAVIECGMSDQGCVEWVNSMATLEESWGSPRITRQIIQGYKDAGFRTVRVPVAWSNKMVGNSIANNNVPCNNGTCISSATQLISGNSYTISPELMDRVQEVVDLILEEDMYVILNIHWDGGWWREFPTDSTEAMRKFLRIWEQVGQQFRDYDDHLMFASLNEEGGWDDIWYIHRNGDDLVAKARAYGLLNTINQAFVSEIRSQGGNNAQRHLQVQGYHTNIDRTIDEMFVMPTDPAGRLAVSVHYYDPFAFTHISEPVDWGGIILPMTTWGTPADHAELNNFMDKLMPRFINQGIPVIMGEYGVASWDAKFERDRASVRQYTLAVTEAMLTRGMLPVLWDTQLNAAEGDIVYYYDRHSASFVDPLLAAGFRALAEDHSVSIRDRATTVRPAAATRPNIAIRGRTLNVSSSTDSDFQVRMFDVKGRVRADFRVSGGVGSYSLIGMPAGRYFVEVRGAGLDVKSVSAIVVR
jgi:endoglucanase